MVFLINVVLWAALGAYLSKVVHMAYAKQTKRALRIRMQKGALLGVIAGFTTAFLNGTHSLNADIQDLLYVAAVVIVCSVPKHNFNRKTKRVLKKQEKKFNAFLAKHPQFKLHKN